MTSRAWEAEARLEVNVSVAGVERCYRERVSAAKLGGLERALRDELSEKDEVVEPLKEWDKESAASVAERWLGGVLRREATRRTRSVKAFFDEEEQRELFDPDVSTAQAFLLMGAPSRYAALRGKRVVARQPLKAGEAVAWNWTTSGATRQDSSGNSSGAKMTFKAVFVPFVDGSELAFPYDGPLGRDLEQGLEVRQEESIFVSSQRDGTLYLVWRSSSDKSQHSDDEEVVLALKVATCDAAAADAARVAARDARLALDAGTFGDKVRNASAFVVRVFSVPPPVKKVHPQRSITGLHVRDKLRKAATRIRGGVESESPLRDGGDDDDEPDPSEMLELAGQRLSALEDEVAICSARAERAEFALELERAKFEKESEANRKHREAQTATLKLVEDRAARSDAKANCAVTALRTLRDHELRAFSSSSSKKNGDVVADEDASDDDAHREWSRLACGDSVVDGAARAARSAAARAAATADRLRAALAKVDKERLRLTDEKRVLVAELRRLRGATDDRVKSAKADADEARMVQRQLAARLSKLKRSHVIVSRKLQNCTCGAADAADDEDLVESIIQGSKAARKARKMKEAQERADTPSSDASSASVISPDEAAQQRRQQAEEAAAAAEEKKKLAEKEEKAQRRAELVAKLEGCRDRQRKLDSILKQNPDIPHMKALKLKLDHAILTLNQQILALDGQQPSSSEEAVRPDEDRKKEEGEDTAPAQPTDEDSPSPPRPQTPRRDQADDEEESEESDFYM